MDSGANRLLVHLWRRLTTTRRPGHQHQHHHHLLANSSRRVIRRTKLVPLCHNNIYLPNGKPRVGYNTSFGEQQLMKNYPSLWRGDWKSNPSAAQPLLKCLVRNFRVRWTNAYWMIQCFVGRFSSGERAQRSQPRGATLGAFPRAVRAC